MCTFNQRSSLHFTVLPFSSLPFTLKHYTSLHFTPHHISKTLKGQLGIFSSLKHPQQFLGPTSPTQYIPGTISPGVKRCVMQVTNRLRLFQKLRGKNLYLHSHIHFHGIRSGNFTFPLPLRCEFGKIK
jgi:hypothetical protein